MVRTLGQHTMLRLSCSTTLHPRRLKDLGGVGTLGSTQCEQTCHQTCHLRLIAGCGT